MIVLFCFFLIVKWYLPLIYSTGNPGLLTLPLTSESPTLLTLAFPATRPLPISQAAQTAKENNLPNSTNKHSIYFSLKNSHKILTLLCLSGKRWKRLFVQRIKQIKAIIAGYLTIWSIAAFLHSIWNTGVCTNLAMVVSKSNLSLLFTKKKKAWSQMQRHTLRN